MGGGGRGWGRGVVDVSLVDPISWHALVDNSGAEQLAKVLNPSCGVFSVVKRGVASSIFDGLDWRAGEHRESTHKLVH